MADHRLWLNTIVMKALQQGRDVSIEKADDYGFHILIDDVPITESERVPEQDEGLPWEGLEYPLLHRRSRRRDRKPSDRALEKIEEVLGDGIE
ncbi:hypothetical protein HT576_09080 [Haloterrigena sp. SYSU A121-1]|uniref:Uncharacterized protein n=1 Tax=Haloterrigena gelatinilytica TaxID=2741724 RepID=A0A8J8GNQ3_9EURY|nr:hypothetical protein [Haloterrigena gelatinilytica]NUB91172.1 hypothetical protein [Haloterrigena gelatinilytica]